MRQIIAILILMPLGVFAQNAQGYFDKAANEYIDVSRERALATLGEAVTKFPNDEDLAELKRRLEEEQNEEQQQQQQQDQQGEGEDQEKKEGENQEQQDQEQQEQDQENQEQKEGEQDQEEKSKEQMTKEKLEEMGISEEKARQLLEAMRQSEIKYLQNQKRKATKRPPSGKPDW